MYPYFLFAAIHHLKSSPTFSVRHCSSVGRVTVDLIRRSWVRFPPGSKDFFIASCGSLFPFPRANAQWVIHTIIYTSELILCSTICVPSATRHNIQLSFWFATTLVKYPYLKAMKRTKKTISLILTVFFDRQWIDIRRLKNKEFYNVEVSCAKITPRPLELLLTGVMIL